MKSCLRSQACALNEFVDLLLEQLEGVERGFSRARWLRERLRAVFCQQSRARERGSKEPWLGCRELDIGDSGSPESLLGRFKAAVTGVDLCDQLLHEPRQLGARSFGDCLEQFVSV